MLSYGIIIFMKIDRLLSIVLLLLTKNKITAKELATYFETSVRTIYRDIDTLCLSGIPIISEQGARGGYSLIEGFTIDKQFFKPEEILTLIAGLKGMETVFDDKHITQTIEKISSLSRDNKNPESVDIDFFGWGQASHVKSNVQLIYKAISQCKILNFTYTNLKEESINRSIEPCKLFYRSGNWYILGFCLNKKDYRFFRISRIYGIVMKQDNFEHREETYNEWNPLTSIEETRKSQEIIFQINSNSAMKARAYFNTQNITELKNGSLEICVKYPIDEWVYSYLLGYGDAITIIKPTFLRNELIRRAQIFLEKNIKLT